MGDIQKDITGGSGELVEAVNAAAGGLVAGVKAARPCWRRGPGAKGSEPGFCPFLPAEIALRPLEAASQRSGPAWGDLSGSGAGSLLEPQRCLTLREGVTLRADL